MTKEEFVELHGEEAWRKLVKPIQDSDPNISRRNNANAIIHFDVIGKVLALLGLGPEKCSGLLEARQKIQACADVLNPTK